MAGQYPRRKVLRWCCWATALGLLFFFLILSDFPTLALALALPPLALPVVLWPYLASAYPAVDRTRRAIFAASCAIAFISGPGVSVAWMIPFALLSSETGRHWEWTSLFYLIFWIPSVITVLVVPRLFSTHLAPRCFSATPTKTPLWAHVLIWPIGIVGAVAWLLFLAIVVATWSSDPLIK